jgi:hypothetical protein
MTVPLFESPEAAALQGFPRQHGRIVAWRAQGDDAYVLLDAGRPGEPYLYGVYCSRHDGRWRGDSYANGPGWSQAGADLSLGTLVDWDVAPEGTDRIRADAGGRTIEEPVDGSVYLAVWWRVPDPAHWPTVTAFRVRGEWRPAE